MINKMGVEQLRSLVEYLEDDRFPILAKLIIERQNRHIDQLISEDSEQTRGRIKELKWLFQVHDTALDELSAKLALEEENKRNLESDVDSNNAAA